MKLSEMEKFEMDRKKPYLPAKRLAAVSGVGDALIRQWLKDGKLSYIQDGSKCLIDTGKFYDYLKSLQVVRGVRHGTETE